MNLLLDTNILVHLSNGRNSSKNKIIFSEDDNLFLSIATLGELRSIAYRNNWTNRRLSDIDEVLVRSVLIEINESLVDAYVQIDTYSQRKNPRFHEYPFSTPRNMGKNDLWIAATAALLNLTLITTDKDFDHLHETFLNVKRLAPENL